MDNYVNLIDVMNEALENKKLTFVPCSKQFISAVVDAIEQLVKERDAAVKCLPQRCTLCKHYTAEDGACYDERKCADWACHPNWEWRGVQE